MPLTDFQRGVLALLAKTRSPDSYLAGGAALHFSPNSTRYSHDLDFFHDSSERVAEAFAEDSGLLEAEGYDVHVEISQPGFIRTTVTKGAEATRIDWAHETAWRFMPCRAILNGSRSRSPTGNSRSRASRSTSVRPVA